MARPSVAGRPEGRPAGRFVDRWTRGSALDAPSWRHQGTAMIQWEKLERVTGIEPVYSAWKAAALPLSYTRPEHRSEGWLSVTRRQNARPCLWMRWVFSPAARFLLGRCIKGVDTLASGNHKPPNETRCASFPTRKCGGVGEWLNPSDCKSDRLAYTGSNPVPSTNSPL